MRKLLAIILLLQIFAIADLKAQSYFQDDLKAFADDYRYLFKSAGQLNGYDLLYPVALIGLSGLSTLLDNDLRSSIGKSTNPNVANFASVTNNFGEAVTVIALPGLVYAVGYCRESEKLRDAGRTAYEAILLTGITATAMKIIVGRARPYNELDNFHFRPLNFSDDFQSFPSMHTAMAFTLATVFANKVDSDYAYPIFYALAASVGFARIHLDKHWFSDVVAGAIIGTLSARAILSAEESRIKVTAGGHIEGKQFVPLMQIAVNF